jgi:hypothetical protein
MAFRVIAAVTEAHRAPVKRGWSPPPEREPDMSLSAAHAFALSLASTLMVSIVIFRAGDGTMGVMPATEYDGDEDAIIHELDPFAP